MTDPLDDTDRVPTTPAAQVPAPAAQVPAPSAPAPAASAPELAPVVSARQLIGASFDLLLRSGEPMRRASFYVGLIVLGTIGPLALALWSLLLDGSQLEFLDERAFQGLELWLSLLLILTTVGIVVASIESIGVAIAILGGAFAGRPLRIREAVQRSRMTFWSIVAASLLVSIPTAIVQQLIGQDTETAFVVGLLIGTAIQTPFVYAQAGIVLGGVGAVEALRRSVRIARARKVAAVILAILPSVYGLLVVLAFSAGVDVAIRSIDALGLGSDSGPAGLAILTVLIVMVVFALGTLLFTATGIIYAPQVVMFVGLTQATIGLDRVRPGGDRDADRPSRVNPPFRWLTRPMLAGLVLGALSLAGFVATALAD